MLIMERQVGAGFKLRPILRNGAVGKPGDGMWDQRMGFRDGALREEGTEGCHASDRSVLVPCFRHVRKGKLIREGPSAKGCRTGERLLGVRHGMALHVPWAGDTTFLPVVGMHDGAYWEERVWCRGVEVRMAFGGRDKLHLDIS